MSFPLDLVNRCHGFGQEHVLVLLPPILGSFDQRIRWLRLGVCFWLVRGSPSRLLLFQSSTFLSSSDLGHRDCPLLSWSEDHGGAGFGGDGFGQCLFVESYWVVVDRRIDVLGKGYSGKGGP